MALVLLVDDDRDILAAFAKFIEDCGYRVHTAPHGIAALEELDRERPDLIITDIMMPQMDGYTFIEHVRRRPLACRVPIVVVSATKARPAAASGIIAYVQKPFDLAEVEALLADVLQSPHL